MSRKNCPHRVKALLFWGIICILPFGFLFLSGEIAFRIYYSLKRATTQTGQQSIIPDERLGWRTAPNYTFHGYQYDAAGKQYNVHIETNQEGFRIFGNKHSRKKKILFLGDSFTHAQQVSNTKTYYGILQEKKVCEVFAYGTSGYGTLQEFMILEQYIDVIEPDLIVLQYCSNDFVNNSYGLELRSTWNNSGKRRPYLTIDGKLIYAIPKTSLVQLRDIVTKHSRFLNSFFWRIDKLYATMYQKTTVEGVIQQTNGEIPLFKQATRITEQILHKMRTRVPVHIPIYAFAVDDITPYENIFKNLSSKHNIYFIDGIPKALKNAEKQGIVTKAADKAHWNETGHAIVANELIRYFNESKRNVLQVHTMGE